MVYTIEVQIGYKLTNRTPLESHRTNRARQQDELLNVSTLIKLSPQIKTNRIYTYLIFAVNVSTLMKHTCNYCKKEFEGRANAATCSTICRASYNHVVRFAAVWGLILPTPEDKPEPKPTPTKTPKAPIIKPKEVKQVQKTKQPTQQAQETSSERWARVQAYKNRHKF